VDLVQISKLFEVRSGDFHAVSELDPGKVPLISCGNSDNGLVGYFDIPEGKTYIRAVTVAYNGQPLTAKFHPYRFGAKDDVAVLVPLRPMTDTAQLYVAALLNNMQWRYSYGRKCFKAKLRSLQIPVPVNTQNQIIQVDEGRIEKIFRRSYKEFVPSKDAPKVQSISRITWKSFPLKALLNLDRGDFHSIASLDPGDLMTVSRVTADNGVVGYFEQPDGAHIYTRGCITISTVGGDSFVQLNEFLATDNVIVCTPKNELRLTTMFFIVFVLNSQKWRYGYGRQCYKQKMEQINIPLPVNQEGQLDENVMESAVRSTAYWPHVEKRFADAHMTDRLSPKRQQVLKSNPTQIQLDY